MNEKDPACSKALQSVTAPSKPIDAFHQIFANTSGAAVAPDRHDARPELGLRLLGEAGLLTAVLSVEAGGHGLCDSSRTGELRDLLIAVGRVSLVLGRLYEGHVNAYLLVQLYGSDTVRRRMADDVHAGHLSGVWNTEPAIGGVKLEAAGDGYVLHGAKSFTSGVGFVTRPLVTGELPGGPRLMVIPELAFGERADLSLWRPHGMRSSATGLCDLEGVRVGPEGIVGAPGDYMRQPTFSGGAWRFLAVQTGGIEAVFEIHRQHLLRTGRGADPHQLARLGLAATAVETARLFVARAAEAAATAEADPASVVATVNLARGAVERAGLDVLELAHRSVGLQGFLEVHPLERASRDLSTYLRQPGPDYALGHAATHLLEADAPLHVVWPLA